MHLDVDDDDDPPPGWCTLQLRHLFSSRTLHSLPLSPTRQRNRSSRCFFIPRNYLRWICFCQVGLNMWQLLGLGTEFFAFCGMVGGAGILSYLLTIFHLFVAPAWGGGGGRWNVKTLGSLWSLENSCFFYQDTIPCNMTKTDSVKIYISHAH